MELGVYTFAEATPDPATGKVVSAERRGADIKVEIELAATVGHDVFGGCEQKSPP
jgi:hypothetical protein